MKRILRAFALTMALVALASAQAPPSKPANITDKELAGQIESLVDKAAAEDSFSGVALVAKDGQAIFRKAVGFANKETRLPNKIDTKFNLGSLNKSFTSVAIAQLAQKGKLQYSDTIDRYLPDYPNKAVAEKVTIHQLLTHSSGLGDYLNNAGLAQVKTLQDLLPLFVNQPLGFAPGEKVQYSNSGYVVLGLIIEKLSGRSYYDYVRENIFKPAGMTLTDSYELNQKVDDLAVGYTSMSREGPQAGPRRANTSTLAGKGSSAGGGYSTVEDMLKFANALGSHKLLTPEFTEIVFTGGGPKKPSGPGGGYGFMQNQMNETRIVGNGGGGPGVNAIFRIYSGRSYTVVVLSNYDPPSAQKIANRIQEMIVAN